MPGVTVSILDASGRVIPAKQIAQSRAMALNSSNRVAYDAADRTDQRLGAWNPTLWSPDNELNPFRDTIVARSRDLVHNDGWAAGVITRVTDNAIGTNFRPITKPDYRFLARETGISGFDHEWAKDFGRAVDAHWRSWADDPGHYCDASRNLTFGQMMRVGFRHELIDGDALALMPVIKERVGYGRGRYGTAVQIIDPDRLSNPQQVYDQQTMRGGVEVDQYGATVAYHIRKAHQGDWWAAADSLTWVRVPRETLYGRSMVVHHFVADRAGQHRGGAGIFTPVMQRLKMLIKYDGSELDAAIINAIFAAYVESPMDPTLVKQAMGGDESEIDAGGSLSGYQEDRMQFARMNGIALNGAAIPHLFPGEEIKTVAATRPTSNFAAFENAVLRNVASGVGLSAQQVSNDWSDVNYSSARGAMLEAWKTLERRRDHFAEGFASPIRTCWLEECFAVDDLPLPAGAPEFMEFRQAYARCRWMGPGRGWIDPVAEVKGAVMSLDAGLTTLEDQLASQGMEIEETLDQQAHEVEMFKARGLALPLWAARAPVPEASKEPEAA